MHEHVLAPSIDGDEAEALLGVEPLHGSVGHDLLLPGAAGANDAVAVWRRLCWNARGRARGVTLFHDDAVRNQRVGNTPDTRAVADRAQPR
ncbi:hypothetical protein Cus16_2926 [Curtobacterium sp. ER1/6]|nr:hypothetical protein Cus16_2926 [Curtobacterium sp. ER1/6]